MAVRKTRNVAYGLNNPLQSLATPPIVSQRNPKVSDFAPIGTIWVNESVGAYYVLSAISEGSANWVAQSSGAGTFPSVDITGNSGTVLEVAAGGDTVLGGDLEVSGVSTFTGNVIVNGDFTANGDWDLESNDAITFVSHSNTAPALSMEVDGGTTATVALVNSTGTSASSVVLESTDGGVLIEATNSISNEAFHVDLPAGGYHLEAALASTVEVTGAGQDLILTATGGSIPITATESVAGAITLTASGVAGTVALAGTGGISIAATNNAIAVTSGTGAVSISADATANTVNVATGAGNKTVVVGSVNTTSTSTLQSGTGGVSIVGTNGVVSVQSGTAACNINTAATANTTTIGNATGASSVVVNVGTGALNLGTTATAHATNVGSTTAGSTLVLNTPTGVNVAAANGVAISTAGRGVSLPGGLLVLAGAGSPDTVVTAPIGSLFLRSDPAGATSRLYVNTDGTTGWTNITCAS